MRCHDSAAASTTAPMPTQARYQMCCQIVLATSLGPNGTSSLNSMMTPSTSGLRASIQTIASSFQCSLNSFQFFKQTWSWDLATVVPVQRALYQALNPLLTI